LDLRQSGAPMVLGVSPPPFHFRRRRRNDQRKGRASIEGHSMDAGEDFIAAK
jgi:hypothetical protein